jgi:hypothetical protein
MVGFEFLEVHLKLKTLKLTIGQFELLAFGDFEGFAGGDAAGFSIAVNNRVVAVKGFSAKFFNDRFFESDHRYLVFVTHQLRQDA